MTQLTNTFLMLTTVMNGNFEPIIEISQDGTQSVSYVTPNGEEVYISYSVNILTGETLFYDGDTLVDMERYERATFNVLYQHGITRLAFRCDTYEDFVAKYGTV